jgi:WS/DGAT/MGAT family acyltransferase
MTRTAPMSAQDSLWLTMDRPNNLMVVDSVLVLAHAPDLSAVRAVMQAAVDRFPVLGRRAVRHGVGWAWQDDPRFDIHRHVSSTPLADAQDMLALQQFVAEQRAIPLDKNRPLWQAFLVHPLRLEDGTEGAAVVARFHHAIADGIRLTQVMISLMGDDLDARASGDLAATPVESPSAATRVVGAAFDLARWGVYGVGEGLGLVRHPARLLDALDVFGGEDHRATNNVSSVAKLAFGGSPRTVWTGSPGTAKAMAWSRPLPLEDIKAIGRAESATVNDVMLGAVAGGMRRYLAVHGGEADEVLWMVPVNLEPFAENLPAELGNYFALVFLPMPLGSADPVTTLRLVRHQMERIKHSDETMLTFGLQRLISLTPPAAGVLRHQFLRQQSGRSPHQCAGAPGADDLRRGAGDPGRGLRPVLGRQPDDGEHLQLQRCDHRRVRHRRRTRPRSGSAGRTRRGPTPIDAGRPRVIVHRSVARLIQPGVRWP